MTLSDYRSLAEPDADKLRAERAKRAVENFRKMLPMLNSYARAFTGDRKITVEVSATSNGATDGRKIFFRPPIALGDSPQHVRKLCDKRDEDTLLQLCEACAAREEVLVTIYHEIAHICYGTFAQPSDADKAQLVAAAVAESGGKYAEYVAERIRRAPERIKSSYIALCGMINPFLPIILNALEDARVNANLFEARRGTKLMFEADTRKLFENGVECPDPENPGGVRYLKWNEREQNMQAIIAMFCKASGYDYEDWFIPEVVAAMEDEQLTELIESARAATNVEETYQLSFKVLDRLRVLGFCKRDNEPEDEEPEPQPEPEQDESDDEPEPEQEEDKLGESEESDEPQDEGNDDSTDAGDTGDAGNSGEEEGDSDDAQDGGDSSEDSADSAGDGDPEDGEDESAPVAGDSEGSAGDDPGTDESGMGDDSDAPESGESDSEELPADSEAEGDQPGEPGTGSGSDSDDGDRPAESSGSDEFEDVEAADTPTEQGTGDIGLPEPLEGDNEDEEAIGDGDEETYESPDRDPLDLTDVEPKSDLPMGEPEDVAEALEQFGHHDGPLNEDTDEDIAALATAIMQSHYFETASENIVGVREHKFGQQLLDANGSPASTAWGGKWYAGEYTRRQMGVDGEFSPNESTVGKALLKLRTVLADNQRSHQMNHLKSGRVNTRVLGRRAPLGDERLFRKKIIPGKRDYFVAIGLDVSGSTIGTNLQLIKSAGWAQAELLKRLGIPFTMHAMTAMYSTGGARGSLVRDGMFLDMYEIKLANEPWNAETQKRLMELGPDGGNLDGHNLEYLRKLCDKSNATDKIIMYYSDGQMPATNYEEELEILQRELVTCKQKGYVVAGVGVRTDSPAQHGLPTVQIDSKDEIIKVVQHLERLMLKR